MFKPIVLIFCLSMFAGQSFASLGEFETNYICNLENGVEKFDSFRITEVYADSGPLKSANIEETSGISITNYPVISIQNEDSIENPNYSITRWKTEAFDIEGLFSKDFPSRNFAGKLIYSDNSKYMLFCEF